jgi:glycosyltransferase involved in cell wall biosynthesis
MNVLVFLTFGVSLKDWQDSGLLNREMRFYEELHSKKKISFTFVTFGTEEDLKYERNFTIIPYYKYNKVLKSKFLTLFQSIMFSRKLISLVETPDLIKTNQLMGSWMAILCKYYLNRPLLIRTGYDIFRFSINDNKNLSKRIFYFILTQITLFLSDTYIVTSISDKLFLEKFFLVSRNKIVINPNWTTSLPKITKEDIESRYDNRVIAVGRLENQKNFSSLIESFTNSDLQIDIVGEGSQKNMLKNLAKDFNVNINFIGKLNHSDLMEKYKEYRVYISSSDYEGNSKSTLEALGYGCLVVTKDIENNSEIISNNISGLLHTKNNLLNLVENYISNIEEIYRISVNAHLSVSKLNSLETIMEKEYEQYLLLTRNN